MPRQNRVDYERAWHHAMNRGAGRREILNDDADRRSFLRCLEDASGSTAVEVHGYCLMSNHFHILVLSREGKLSDFLRLLSGRYSHTFNRRWNSDGPIFRARCQSVEITSDAQLVATSRYIHLNPVKARLVSDPCDWQWSSAAAYLRDVTPPQWLRVETVMEMFATTTAITSYASYLNEVVDAMTAKTYEELGWN